MAGDIKLWGRKIEMYSDSMYSHDDNRVKPGEPFERLDRRLANPRMPRFPPDSSPESGTAPPQLPGSPRPSALPQR